MSSPAVREQPDPGEHDIRSELNRILSSPEFRAAERLTRLLRHVVERTIDGATDSLKESILGLEVFDRTDFDPRLDPIVRVEASRLRKRLEDFYRRSGCPSGIAIALPKGTYSAAFERREARSANVPAPALRTRRRIAVVAAGDGCAAVADEILHDTVRCGRFDVVPWTAHCSSESEALRAASTLDLDLLVWICQRRDNETGVWIRVIDVRNGLYVASESVAAAHEAEVAGFLDRAGTLGGGQPQIVRGAPSAAAYNLYLKGRYYWNLRTEAGLWRAVEYFQQAIVEDAGCALAYTGLADAYTLLANYGAVAPDEVRPRAKENALRAMEIDGTLAEAHTSLAHVHSTYEWDWQTSELEYLTAVRLNPSYATAHHWYAITLLAPLRRLDEALEEIGRARECDAISLSIRRDEALVQLYRGEAEAALNTATQLVALDARFSGAWWLMGLVTEYQCAFDAAFNALRHSVDLSQNHPRMLGALGHAYAVAGRTVDAEAVLRQLESLRADRYVSPCNLALVQVGLGQHDAAFSHLREALSLRSYDLVTLQVDPRYNPLRPMTAYRQMLQTMGLSRTA